jgi:hypothetical protein
MGDKTPVVELQRPEMEGLLNGDCVPHLFNMKSYLAA